tara:strand:- start:306 stop:1142 length:837 start_codon:yes stop_codon:yes gene_type:complete
MGGEVEETELHPEEAEPKVADATKHESDEWPSDPGSDASDGDRDRRPGAHNNDGGAPSVSNATGDDAGRKEGRDTDSDGPDRSRGGDSDSPRDSPTAPSKPRGRTAWEWFVFIVGILGQLLYDLILLASPDTTRRQRRYGSLMDDSDGRSPRSRARGGARPAPAGASQGGREGQGGGEGGAGEDEGHVRRRGLTGVRQRARDANEVPEELRGLVSPAQWRMEMQTFHEAQLKKRATEVFRAEMAKERELETEIAAQKKMERRRRREQGIRKVGDWSAE